MEYINIIYLNSSNADYVDLTTSRARWILQPPLQFPTGKVKVSLHSFSFVNYFINIVTGLNDTFYYTDDILDLVKFSVTIPQGSYNVSDLSDAVNVGIINNTHPDGLISLVPDFATNRVLFSISQAGWMISFGAGTPFLLVGCNLNQTIPAGPALTVGAYSELGPNVATFNEVQTIYVHSNITNNSIFNGIQSNILGSVVPTASIGSTQSDKEINLIWTDCAELSNSSLNEFQVYLTDQNNNPVRLSDNFALTLMFGLA